MGMSQFSIVEKAHSIKQTVIDFDKRLPPFPHNFPIDGVNYCLTESHAQNRCQFPELRQMNKLNLDK